MRALAARPGEFRWLVERTGAGLTADARGIKAVDSSGRTRGMVVYDAWAYSSCQAHMAVDTPIAWRGLLPAVFEYPFLECGLDVLVGVIPGDNNRSRRMVEALGFREAHVIRDGWRRGVGLHVYEMRRGGCRYLPTPRGPGLREGSAVQCPPSHGRAAPAAEAPTTFS